MDAKEGGIAKIGKEDTDNKTPDEIDPEGSKWESMRKMVIDLTVEIGSGNRP